MTPGQRFYYYGLCAICYVLAQLLAMQCLLFSWQWWLFIGAAIYATQPFWDATTARLRQKQRKRAVERPGLYQLIDDNG